MISKSWRSFMRRRFFVRAALTLSAVLGLFSLPVFAGTIGVGNLVIYRAGDGSAALNANATAVFLDEYTMGGTPVQSIALPSSGGSALTATGNSTTEGIISRAQDGKGLLFTGYRKATGGATGA